MKRQRGLLLPAAMLLLLLVTLPGLATWTLGRRSDTQMALAQAKEALIARAVNDDNRPGSLPCPDLMTDSPGLDNRPGDGRADMFTLTQCPSYLGWLPWRTLDLPVLQDEAGNVLWYALGPALRDDDSAHPVNSDTLPGLTLDGDPEIAAVLIAPRAPLAMQQRPSQRPADYLEGDNASNLRRFVSQGAPPLFNDQVLAIRREELMAATEQRVIGDVRQCLEAHARSPVNASQAYPWPAPLGETPGRGHPGSHFGRLPQSQPESSLERRLQTALQGLTGLDSALFADNPSAPLANVLGANAESLSVLRNLADSIYWIGNTLWQQLDPSLSTLANLQRAADQASSDGRISRSEGSLLRRGLDTGQPALAAVTRLLQDHGLDPLSSRFGELGRLLSETPGTAAELAEIEALLSLAASPRQEMTQALDGARLAWEAYRELPNTLTRQPLAQRLSALQDLARSSQVALRAHALNEPLALLSAHLRDDRPAERNALLAATERQLHAILDGPQAIREQADETLRQIETARTDPAALRFVHDALGQLQTILLDNESRDGNLSRSTLTRLQEQHRRDADAFIRVDTATPRPVQRDIVPYAVSLARSSAEVSQLLRVLADQVARISPQAKAHPLPPGTSSDKAIVLDDSAYQRAQHAIDALSGRNSPQEAWRLYQAAPGAASREKLTTALQRQKARNAEALRAAEQLANALASSHADAQPMLWLSARCDFLRSGHWWQANRWGERVFFQIAGSLPDNPARLSVNGRSRYRLVVVAAGRALRDQKPGGLSANIADYLEAPHATAQRQGLALAPEITWQSARPSTHFNDRLSY